MTEEISLAAVVVTHNRAEKLGKVLDALAAQTRTPDMVYVIDNASTDDTADVIEAQASALPVTHHRLLKNLGGAGGFHAGVKLAWENGHDLFWISDDDAYPKADAIERLHDALMNFEAEHGVRPSFACSRVEWTNGQICEMNVPNTVWDWTRFVDREITRPLVSSCSFVSVLVPKWAVKEHGLPIPEYFIWFDDSEYTSRIARTYPGIFVPESQVIHDMRENKGVNYGDVTAKNVWKFRYGARNETSYRLRETGFPGALAFAYKVHKEMKEGKVPFGPRCQVFAALLRGWSFRPAIPPAPKEPLKEGVSPSVKVE